MSITLRTMHLESVIVSPFARRSSHVSLCYDRSRASRRERSCARFASSARTDTSDSRRRAKRASGSASPRGPTTSPPIPAATTSVPMPLGSDTSTSPLAWQTHDLELMLLAARELGVPMIIGSAGDTGANSRVDLYVQIIKELAAKHRLAPFKLGYFYSEVEQGGSAPADARRRDRCGTRRSRDADRGRARRHRADRRDGRRASVHRAAGAGRRRHHRRPQQRQLRVRRAGDPSRFSGEPGVLPRQGARMRVVLRRALRRQGDGAGRGQRRRGRGHRDASGAALHGGVGRRARDVRALESVLRARRRRHARHVRVPLRADRREDHADHRREVRAAPPSFA